VKDLKKLEKLLEHTQELSFEKKGNLKFREAVQKDIEEAFRILKNIAPTRPVACDDDLDRIEEAFLQYLLAFGNPMRSIRQQILIMYREQFGRTLTCHTAYEGSGETTLWGEVFDALHSPPTFENLGEVPDSYYTVRSGKRFSQYAEYLQNLPLSPAYPRYFVLRRIYRVAYDYCRTLHQTIVDLRRDQKPTLRVIEHKAGLWSSDTNDDVWDQIWGQRTYRDPAFDKSDGAAFKKLSTSAYITEFLRVATRIEPGETDPRAADSARALVNESLSAFAWMEAVYEAARSLVQVERYKETRDKGYGDWTLTRLQKAYNMLIGLQCGSPLDWEYVEEKKLATFILSKVAWLFTDIQELSYAATYEALYVQRWNTHPDDELAWLAEEELRGDWMFHSRDTGKRKPIPAPKRERWFADRRAQRDAWRHKYRRTSSDYGDPPSAGTSRAGQSQQTPRQQPETPEQQQARFLEERKQHLRALFNSSDTWTARQDAITSSTDLFIFLEWLYLKHKPPDARRYARFADLIRAGRVGTRSASRRMCRAVVQIYHPDSNVMEDNDWQELAQEVTKVLIPQGAR